MLLNTALAAFAAVAPEPMLSAYPPLTLLLNVTVEAALPLFAFNVEAAAKVTSPVYVWTAEVVTFPVKTIEFAVTFKDAKALPSPTVFENVTVPVLAFTINGEFARFVSTTDPIVEPLTGKSFHCPVAPNPS